MFKVDSDKTSIIYTRGSGRDNGKPYLIKKLTSTELIADGYTNLIYKTKLEYEKSPVILSFN